MSEKEQATRPASYPSARPLAHEQGQTTYHASQLSGGNGRYQPQSRPQSQNKMALAEPPQSKGIGMYNLLNPAAPRQMPSIDDKLSTMRRRPSGPDVAAGSHGHGHTTRSLAPIPQVSTSLPVTPNTKVEGQHAPFSERNSPTTGYPFPRIDDSAKSLSPKPPRPLSYQEKPSRDTETRYAPLLPQTAGSKRPHESSQAGRDPRHYASVEPADRQHGTPPTQPPQALQLQQQDERRVVDRPVSTLVTQEGIRTHRHASAGTNEDNSPTTSDKPPTQSGGRASFAREPHQTFIQLPGNATPIPIQVDYSQASKKADEKRQRNAKASTRHRRKKKTLQEENVRQLQDLKDDRSQMIYHIEELSRHCEFYKAERNRLRNIVGQTPGLSHHAAGPPSPRPLPNIMTYIEGSPDNMMGHIQTPPQGYASETPSLERPAQRRRTDDQTEYQQPLIGGGPPAPLPPLQGLPPRPQSATALGPTNKLLPPLRALETPLHPAAPHPGMPHHGVHHEQDPTTGQWRPVQPRPYESGWSTNVRG